MSEEVRDKFEDKGKIVRAKSGRSLKIDLADIPFTSPYYASEQEVLDVIEGRREYATIWMLTKEDKFKER